MRYLLIQLFIFSWLSSLTFDISFESLKYHYQKDQGYDRIILDSGVGCPFPPGAPEIPVLTYSYIIPSDQRVVSIEIKGISWQEESGTYDLYPRQIDASIETSRTFTPVDSNAYNCGVGFPDHPVFAYEQGNVRGYRILQVTIAPFKYHSEDRRLYKLRNMRIQVFTEFDDKGVLPKRMSTYSRGISEDFLRTFAINKTQIDVHQALPFCSIMHNNKDSLPTSRPSLRGPPVDLVVITNNEQVTAYEKFCQYKKQLGLFSTIRTLSWIRQHYPGIDDAERIRNFIRDAVTYWGTSFIILGGDTDIVPTRFVWIDRSVVYGGLWLPIASDLYFSSLDGTWNFDGDHKFGEVSDSVDLYPDVFVGRIPTKTPDHVFEYLDKLKSYLQPSNTEIQTRALFFSSYLASNWPGWYYAYELADHLPAYFEKDFLAEDFDNLTIPALYDSIYAGYGIVTGIGHGDVNNMCIKYSTWPRIYFNNFFYDSLSNTDLYSLLTVVTCYTNPFQSDCLGEHWVRNPNGGGIAYIGPTSSSEGSIHNKIMTHLYDSLFTCHLGQALAYAKINFIPNAQYDNWHRVHQYSISLLGDPTLRLWDKRPAEMSEFTVQPDTLEVGTDTITFYFGPDMAPHLRKVHFHKEQEVFTVDSSNTNILQHSLETESSGYLKYAIVADPFIMHVDSIYVKPAASFLAYHSNMVVDTTGNSNGEINPGEEIHLYIGLKNNGSANAQGVSAQIVCTDGFVSLVNDTAGYPDIAAGLFAYNSMPFILDVSDTLPDQHRIAFDLVITWSSGTRSDSFEITGFSPKLSYFKQIFADSNDTIAIVPFVANQGHCPAQDVQAFLSSLTDSVVLLDSVVQFPLIGINEVVSSAPDEFRVLRSSPACTVRLNVRIVGGNGEIADHTIILDSVPAIDSIWTTSGVDEVTLKWSPVDSMRGYRIYRSLSYNGQYSFLKNDLSQTCNFSDHSVTAGCNYYYYVEVVDSSFNQGRSRDTVCSRTNPPYAAGWPQEVFGFQYASPNFGDIDRSYPGLEIVSAGLDGCIYAWHADGTPVADESGILFDAGDDYIWSSPAIGDVDDDGALEISFMVMRNSENLYVIRYNEMNNQAVVLPGWPKSLNNWGCVNSPIFADIDEDGDLEIFALASFPGKLYVFHHDGSGVYSANGLLKSLYGDVRGTPALADIDADGHLEIICCGGHETDSFFVWDRFGDYLPPFPVVVEPNQEYGVIAGDIIGDASLEMLFYTGRPSYKLNVIDHSGTIIWQQTVLANYIELCPALGDISGDGAPEVIFSYNDGLDAGVVVYDSLGNIRPGFPVWGHDAFPPVIVDTDGDGLFDLVCGSTEWNLCAYNGVGRMTPGFPIKLGQRINSTPAVYDIDFDGHAELMVSCYDLKFHVFKLQSGEEEWPKFHYDPYNSGWYRSGFYGRQERRQDNKAKGFAFAVYPNPFQLSTTIKLQIPNPKFQTPATFGDIDYRDKKTTLKIYDVAGRLVKSFDLGNPSKYVLSVTWQGDDDVGRTVSSGIYFIRLELGDISSVHKVIKIR